MAEVQKEQEDRIYMIPPNIHRHIGEFLKKHPNRYNDTRNFVTDAIRYFLAWETDPPAARKMMEEDFKPLLPQMAYSVAQGWSGMMNDTWPGLLDANKDQIDQFLVEHPEYYSKQQGGLSASDAQTEARASKGDLEKLRERQNDVWKFIEKIDFNKVQPEGNLKEIFYDGWPLLSTHYSRILPAKVSISAIVDLMWKQKSLVITLDDTSYAYIYDIAEEFSTELRTKEMNAKSSRPEKYSTGLPKLFQYEKITAQQALSQKRWKDRFIGKRSKGTEPKTDEPIEFFNGILSALGLVRVFYDEDKKKVNLTLTTKGKKFYSLPNNFFWSESTDLDLPSEYRGSLERDERKFLIKEILPERKLEMELIRATVKTLRKLGDKDEKKPVSMAMTKRLDEAFLLAVEKFVKEEANGPIRKKIQHDIVDKTAEKEDKTTVTPIQAHRVATMGRLSEIGLVKWEILEDASSTYKIEDEEMASLICE